LLRWFITDRRRRTRRIEIVPRAAARRVRFAFIPARGKSLLSALQLRKVVFIVPFRSRRPTSTLTSCLWTNKVIIYGDTGYRLSWTLVAAQRRLSACNRFSVPRARRVVRPEPVRRVDTEIRRTRGLGQTTDEPLARKTIHDANGPPPSAMADCLPRAVKIYVYI